MVLDNYEMLKKLYQELRQEYEDVKKQAESDEDLIPVSDSLYSKVTRLDNILKQENECNMKFFHIQEDERYRISRDLHDTSLQNLAHLVHKIELSSMYIDQDPVRAKLELSVISKKLKDTIEEIRNTIFNLRPMEFDDLGLKATLERLIDTINIDKRYEVDFNVEDVSCENNLILFSIYRAVQECLNNIVKHADATKILLHAQHIDDKYCITIVDNGKGFCLEEIEEKKNCHFGISLIKERISILLGTVNFSADEHGTKIVMEIPIKELGRDIYEY